MHFDKSRYMHDDLLFVNSKSPAQKERLTNKDI